VSAQAVIRLLCVLALLIPAMANAELKPEPHPSAKKKPTTTWAYTYWTTGAFTLEDGTKITVRVKCRVSKKGKHSCSVQIPS
jgi:hypothetical protein